MGRWVGTCRRRPDTNKWRPWSVFLCLDILLIWSFYGRETDECFAGHSRPRAVEPEHNLCRTVSHKRRRCQAKDIRRVRIGVHQPSSSKQEKGRKGPRYRSVGLLVQFSAFHSLGNVFLLGVLDGVKDDGKAHGGMELQTAHLGYYIF